MAQTFHPVTPVECTPVDTLWQPIDLDDYIAGLGADVTGVILHYVNFVTGVTYIGFRKNGSTDDRHEYMQKECHAWAAIGVDATHIFECYLGALERMNVYVVGYTTTGVTFATNATEKVPAGEADWWDVDCSTEAPEAIGLIFEVTADSGIDDVGLKKNGSTDDRKSYGPHDTSGLGCIVGCDASQICEVYRGETDTHFWLLGYITDGYTAITNATDLSLDTTDTWQDLTALPDVTPAPIMGFIEVYHGVPYEYGLRKNVSGEDIYWNASCHCWAFVECDANRVIEGKIENTALDFFLMGYAVGGIAGWSGKVSGVTDPAKVLGVAKADIKKVMGVE